MFAVSSTPIFQNISELTHEKFEKPKPILEELHTKINNRVLFYYVIIVNCSNIRAYKVYIYISRDTGTETHEM